MDLMYSLTRDLPGLGRSGDLVVFRRRPHAPARAYLVRPLTENALEFLLSQDAVLTPAASFCADPASGCWAPAPPCPRRPRSPRTHLRLLP